MKDLPLHEVSNEDVLTAIKRHVQVLSDVKYSNVFVDGKRTHLHNGDRFVYIASDQLDKVPQTFSCRIFVARVIKPVKFQTCHRCGQVGHKASCADCPGLAPPDVQASIQSFKGGHNELSNLHVCSESCAWQTNGVQFESAEKEFQLNKLVHYGKDKEADRLLTIESSLEVMGEARKVVLEPDSS